MISPSNAQNQYRTSLVQQQQRQQQLQQQLAQKQLLQSQRRQLLHELRQRRTEQQKQQQKQLLLQRQQQQQFLLPQQQQYQHLHQRVTQQQAQLKIQEEQLRKMQQQLRQKQQQQQSNQQQQQHPQLQSNQLQQQQQQQQSNQQQQQLQLRHLISVSQKLSAGNTNAAVLNPFPGLSALGISWQNASFANSPASVKNQSTKPERIGQAPVINQGKVLTSSSTSSLSPMSNLNRTPPRTSPSARPPVIPKMTNSNSTKVRSAPATSSLLRNLKNVASIVKKVRILKQSPTTATKPVAPTSSQVDAGINSHSSGSTSPNTNTLTNLYSVEPSSAKQSTTKAASNQNSKPTQTPGNPANFRTLEAHRVAGALMVHTQTHLLAQLKHNVSETGSSNNSIASANQSANPVSRRGSSKISDASQSHPANTGGEQTSTTRVVDKPSALPAAEDLLSSYIPKIKSQAISVTAAPAATSTALKTIMHKSTSYRLRTSTPTSQTMELINQPQNPGKLSD
ncbi:hypothetical protein PoB_002790400, partial [Plakobranchus ocellatus]